MWALGIRPMPWSSWQMGSGRETSPLSSGCFPKCSKSAPAHTLQSEVAVERAEQGGKKKITEQTTR